ncbi:hypothetical protein GCM10009850_027490 [Nonomuraea monospora]|uniref:RES domain-containing protein n=1 Tax=Nonomuraea monospora TaxID=568818 RepID=A0ABP5P8H1_9ACTN
MPLQLPPERCPGQVAMKVLPAGTRLWRVHSARYAADACNPVPADRKIGGGRFDCTMMRPFPYLYAAREQSTALMETVVRSLLFDGENGGRLVRHARLEALRMSAIDVVRDLRLVSLLSAEDLSGVCQDGWLLDAEAEYYHITRHWSLWLHERDWRGQHAWPNLVPQGLIWQAKRDRPREAMMFFGDRCMDAFQPVANEGYLLADERCHDQLTGLLAPYGVTLGPSPKRADRPLSVPGA